MLSFEQGCCAEQAAPSHFLGAVVAEPIPIKKKKKVDHPGQNHLVGLVSLCGPNFNTAVQTQDPEGNSPLGAGLLPQKLVWVPRKAWVFLGSIQSTPWERSF